MKPALPVVDGSPHTIDQRLPPCVDRREFLSHSAFIALGTLIVAACGTGSSGSNGPTGPGTVNVTVNLADYPALATVGGIVRLNGTSTPVAVVRASTTSYRAFWLQCPHQGTTVLVNGASFRCPNHFATFNGSGQWTGGQPTSNLHEFTVATNTSANTITVT